MMKTAILIGLATMLVVAIPGASASAINTIVLPGGGGSGCPPLVSCAVEFVIDACNAVVYFLVGGYCY